ncbi:MAG: protein arginine kinase [Eubacteriales bacterium]|nr:protein arginine kinase [Eubacteriales bacterium]
MPRWLEDNAPESDVVISTRIRLARNLADVPFPSKIRKRSDIELVHSSAKDCLLKASEFKYVRLSDMSELSKRALTERHIISNELARKKDGGLITSGDESISVLIMEEDHYRLQSISAGLAINKAYNAADHLDIMLSDGVSFAYDEELGFLTSCPTNAGTGLRASVMLHLPALTAAKGIQRVIAMISKVGMTVRGAFGEGSEASGAFYQISNQITLGVSEKEILMRLLTTANKVIDFERHTRRELYRNLGIALEDRIWRAIGVLRNARKMSDVEAQKLISDVAFGVALGFVPKLSSSTLYRVMMDTRPAVLAEGNNSAQPQQRDVVRADILRKVFDI